MLKAAFTLVLFLFSCSFSLFGKIVDIETIDRFEAEAGIIDQHTWVIFDVDDTLIVPTDGILMPKGKKLLYELVDEILQSQTCKYDGDALFSRILKTADHTIVEARTTDLIRELQDKKTVVFAYTAADSGQIGEIVSFSDFRVDHLKTFGYDFKTAFPHLESVILTKQEHQKCTPLFKAGVLFSSNHPKGDVLKEFLAKCALSPKKIVFIDDKLSYLKSVEGAMDSLGIEFVGLRYGAAERLSNDVDKNLALFQFKHLASEGEWLSDEQARKKLVNITN